MLILGNDAAKAATRTNDATSRPPALARLAGLFSTTIPCELGGRRYAFGRDSAPFGNMRASVRRARKLDSSKRNWTPPKEEERRLPIRLEMGARRLAPD